MGEISVQVLREIEEGVEVGSIGCVCGACRPTATIYREDPTYEAHPPKLAEGPCCCGRFFVVGHDEATAEGHALQMAEERNRTGAGSSYRLDSKRLALPWGTSFDVVVAHLTADPQEP